MHAPMDGNDGVTAWPGFDNYCHDAPVVGHALRLRCSAHPHAIRSELDCFMIPV